MGHQSNNTLHLTRSDLWTNELKEILQDDLMATKFIRWIDFGEGEVLHIPSIGEIEAQDYVEGQAVEYSALDTGDFEFSVTEYKQSGVFITNKAKQDLFYAAQLESRFVPAMQRALAVRLEVDALRVGPEAQTAGDPNALEGVAHRWVGTGGTGGGSISVEDFARARLALQKANVPMTNLIAIVDPSVAYTFNTLANITNVINNPKWEGIVRDGISTGMQFKANIYGFDVYESNYLSTPATETIYGKASGSNAVANLFFSAASGVQPIIGAIRQPPKVDSEYNKDEQRDEYVTTCRYGMKAFRLENLVTVLTDKSISDPTY